VEGLTPTQAKVQEAIELLFEAAGPDPVIFPTYQEVAEKAGLHVGSVHRIAKRLEQDGLIARSQGRARSLRPKRFLFTGKKARKEARQ
jgi:DNA-binding MarR family transcriptional regulator